MNSWKTQCTARAADIDLGQAVSIGPVVVGLVLSTGEGRGGHCGLNQRVRLSYDNVQIPTDCFAETPVTVSFDHILCTFWCIHTRRLTHQMTNQ